MRTRRKGRGPIRTCIGCGKRDVAGELIRLARRSDGSLVRNQTGSEPGRGGYLHQVEDCWSKFMRHRGTIRSFRATIQPQPRAAMIDVLQAGVDL